MRNEGGHPAGSRKAVAADARLLVDCESAARRWFLRMRVPCWLSDAPPGGRGRYGIVFACGRRALVVPPEGWPVSLDAMAAAGCDLLVQTGPGAATPDGFLAWFDVRRAETARKGGPLPELRPMGTLLPLLRPGYGFAAAMALGSLKLLVLGETRPPDPLRPGDLIAR